MTKFKTACACGLATVMASALTGALPSLAQDVPTIRVGWTMPAEDTKYWMKQRPDQFPNLGSAYNIEWVQFQGTAPMVQAMIAGALDCSTQGALSLANGHLQGGLEAYVVAQHLGTAPGSFAPYWAVLEDSAIQQATDFADKTVGINVLGSGLYGPLALYLLNAGLDPKTDIKLVETGFPGAEDALRTGRVDIALFNQPFAAAAEARGGIRSVFSISEVVPVSVQIFEACSKSFVDANPELASLYVSDLTTAMGKVLSDRDESLNVASEVTMAPLDVLETFYLTDQDFVRTEGAAVDFSVLQAMLDLYHDAGMTSDTIDAAIFEHPSIVAPLAE